jgi:hypothetical protein
LLHCSTNTTTLTDSQNGEEHLEKFSKRAWFLNTRLDCNNRK